MSSDPSLDRVQGYAPVNRRHEAIYTGQSQPFVCAFRSRPINVAECSISSVVPSGREGVSMRVKTYPSRLRISINRSFSLCSVTKQIETFAQELLGSRWVPARDLGKA